MTPELKRKNRQTGLFLAAILLGLIVYSLIVISTRGDLPQPTDLTYWQKIFRGL